jgi:predicted nuclease of predicted toxin-antitoxin system
VPSVSVLEGRILVTLDLDFANLLNYPPKAHPGIIVLRLQVQNTPAIVSALRRFLQQAELDELKGCLTIVDEFRYRIRAG